MQPLLRTSRLLGERQPASYQSSKRTILSSKRQALLPPVKAAGRSRQLRGHPPKGKKPWEGLVDWDKETIDKDLRDILISYGELVQAAYDNLNTDANRPNACGLPRHNRASMLSFSVPAHPKLAHRKLTTAERYKVTKLFLANTARATTETDKDQGTQPAAKATTDSDKAQGTQYTRATTETDKGQGTQPAKAATGSDEDRVYYKQAKAFLFPTLNVASILLAELVINQLFKAPKTEPDRPVWLGYVALSQDEKTNEAKDVAVVFRGTIFKEEWMLNIAGDWMVLWEKEKLGSPRRSCAAQGEVGQPEETEELGSGGDMRSKLNIQAVNRMVSWVKEKFCSKADSEADMRVHQGFYNLYTTELNLKKVKEAIVAKELAKEEGWEAVKEFWEEFKKDHETKEDRETVKKFWDRSAPPPYKVIEGELKKLLTENDVATITTTGHSLGAALATISALHIAAYLDTEFDKWLEADPDMKTKTKPSVTGFPFASPRVGGLAMLDRVDNHSNLKILRIANVRDIVPQVPGILRLLSTILIGPSLVKILGIDGSKRGMERGAPDGLWPLNLSTIPLRLSIMHYIFWPLNALLAKIGAPPLSGVPWDYFHVGQMLLVDSGHESVKQTIRPLTELDFGPKHNNEVYLHLISAQWGGQLFKRTAKGPVGRQPALMNKSDDVVDPELRVPVGWWKRNIATMEYDSKSGEWVALDMVSPLLVSLPVPLPTPVVEKKQTPGNGTGNGNVNGAIIENNEQNSSPGNTM